MFVCPQSHLAALENLIWRSAISVHFGGRDLRSESVRSRSPFSRATLTTIYAASVSSSPVQHPRVRNLDNLDDFIKPWATLASSLSVYLATSAGLCRRRVIARRWCFFRVSRSVSRFFDGGMLTETHWSVSQVRDYRVGQGEALVWGSMRRDQRDTLGQIQALPL
ncbi:hypothetical protein MIND_01381600 [Mycena indigotica]|uniref:Uncharacterized protein n=1 Tax=Mycena indigotica TaxID=2126181 RepID=A0A8H6RXN1_9AGAR|nr:uncharacterized protein MIND_01381600 [Mycena indigotica]KAF7289204.1 hypothetical protein MIND_01381600 [Mycena indigotica]